MKGLVFEGHKGSFKGLVRRFAIWGGLAKLMWSYRKLLETLIGRPSQTLGGGPLVADLYWSTPSDGPLSCGPLVADPSGGPLSGRPLVADPLVTDP